MRRVPLSGSESLFLSARIALDAAGIPYTESSLGTILVDDADYDRARAAMADLQDTMMESPVEAQSSPIYRAFVRAIASGVIWVWVAHLFHKL